MITSTVLGTAAVHSCDL